MRKPAANMRTSFVHAKQKSLVVNLHFHTIADVIFTEATDKDDTDTDDADVTKLKLTMLMLLLLMLTMLMLLILMMLVTKLKLTILMHAYSMLTT